MLCVPESKHKNCMSRPTWDIRAIWCGYLNCVKRSGVVIWPLSELTPPNKRCSNYSQEDDHQNDIACHVILNFLALEMLYNLEKAITAVNLIMLAEDINTYADQSDMWFISSRNMNCSKWLNSPGLISFKFDSDKTNHQVGHTRLDSVTDMFSGRGCIMCEEPQTYTPFFPIRVRY